MKLLFIIDSFGSGGAQRQLSLLTQGIIARGHSVDIFNYFPQYNFFRAECETSGAKIYDHFKLPGFDFSVIKKLRSLLIKNDYDLSLAFLDTPSTCLLLASVGLNVKVVVSDRNSYIAGYTYRSLLKKQMLRLADTIIANSMTQADWLIQTCRLPKNLVHAVYNGYNLETLKYSPLTFSTPTDLKLIGIGRLSPQKNIECLIAGLNVFFKRHGWLPCLNWAGITDNVDYKTQLLKLLNEHPEVQSKWSWLGERKDIPDLLACHHALILPSKFEGLPNAVCEAMFAGKPILCSNVCDNPYLIKEDINGFLFSPDSPEQLANAIEKLIQLAPSQNLQMSHANRKFAEQNLNLDIMIDSYEALFKKLLG